MEEFKMSEVKQDIINEENVLGGRVNLDERYYFRMDSRNFVLCEEKIAKTGKSAGMPVESVIGYFTSIEGMLKRYVRELIVNGSNGKTMTLIEFKKVLGDIKNHVKAISDQLSYDV